jgi:allophanate hydrolase subunit 2
VQVPADGRPLVFLADHPTTGGYPVIGVVPAGALPALAQARPGTALVFEPAQYSDS